MDLRLPAVKERHQQVTYYEADIRSNAVGDIIARENPDVVVHLAAIVNPGNLDRQTIYAIDVAGTENLLQACIRGKVKRFVFTSSGAAYGYHADNPEWLTESDPLRGNYEFPYSWHKRKAEELLAAYRNEHPRLEQVIFRVGTIIGKGTRNQITDLFDRPKLLAIRGSPSPFVFIWDQELVGILVRALEKGPPGIYNVAGDGALSADELAAILGKKVERLPAFLVQAVLAIAHPLKLSQYGPEQVRFLRYRPVLDNRRLKEVFGYTPKYTSRQAFEAFATARRALV